MDINIKENAKTNTKNNRKFRKPKNNNPSPQKITISESISRSGNEHLEIVTPRRSKVQRSQRTGTLAQTIPSVISSGTPKGTKPVRATANMLNSAEAITDLVVASFVNPGEYANTHDLPIPRAADDFSSVPTSAASMFLDVDCEGYKPSGTTIVYQDIFVFRNPYRAAIVHSDTLSSGVYIAGFTTGTGLSNVAQFQRMINEEKFLIPSAWSHTSGEQVHGQYMYQASTKDSEDSYVFMHGADAMRLTFNGTLGAADYRLNVYRWVEGVPRLETQINAAAADHIEFVPESNSLDQGYYMFSLTWLDASMPYIPTAMVLTVNGNTLSPHNTFWRHYALPYASQLATVAEAWRAPQFSTLFTNLTPELYRGGIVSINQFTEATSWLDVAADKSYVRNSVGSATMDAKNGVYGWFRPTGPSVFDLKMSNTVNGGRFTGAWYDLNEDHLDMIAVQATLPYSTEGPQKFRLRVDGLFEFQNQSQLLSKQVPTIPRSMYMNALGRMKFIPQFSSNKEHTLLTVLRKFGKGINTHLPNIMNNLTKFAPYAMRFGGFLASM